MTGKRCGPLNQQKNAMWAGQMVSLEGMREQLLCRELCYIQHHLSYGQMRTGQNILRKLLGGAKGECFVETPFWCTYGNRITVGENFRASHHLTILDAAPVTFGNHVCVGPNCRFHTAGYPQYAGRYAFASPITVGNRVWIGSGVTVLPGVSIGDGTVVSAGSVVTSDLPPGVVAAGNPCRVIRFLTEGERGCWKN
jgi:acetyltransferase-like isoleucine patch superfamily enzyme